MQRLGITYRLTALLALLSTAPLVFVVFNSSSSEIVQRTRHRLVSCEQFALSCSLHLKRLDYQAMEQQFERFMQRSESLEGVRLIRFDGLVIHQLGSAGEDVAVGEMVATANHIRIPILRNSIQWGHLEADYADELVAEQLWSVAEGLLLTLALNLLTFGLLLRRSLAVSDSGSAVPRRVRNTLDTIAGGVVILDANRNIVMANEAFQASCRLPVESLIGMPLRDIPFRTDDELLPWDQAIADKQRKSGFTLFLDDGECERCFVVNATPIFDSKDAIAGTLVSFEDVTALEQQKQSLLRTLNELEISKDQIHQQNLRLQELASRDALTGAFNRRSLFEQLELLWQSHAEHKQSLSCIMFDVDHFKKLNDNYGHAVGDQVLRDVSRTIQAAVPAPGFAGRYGGEEFCVVLPMTRTEQAIEIAESVRHAIETKLAEPYGVTASLGVSGSEFGAENFQLIIEQADQALYAAKHAGRNAVRSWSKSMALGAEDAPGLKVTASSDQPISYHAVVSLHAALAYRDADTAVHSQRVAEMSVSLARGLLPISQLYVLEIGALLHDIGKLGVPDSILLKPDKLTQPEWKVMEAHARMGVEIVESSFTSKTLSDIVRYHHYHYDGSNAPEGEPIGDEIPLEARIVCVVDAYDAMTANRVYRKGHAPEAAFEELRRRAGTQFDPQLVQRFIEQQIGWQADSDMLHADLEDELAISVGHMTERTMHAFEHHDSKMLLESLEKLIATGAESGLPAIQHLAAQLSQSISGAPDKDWEFALPILQDLLEVCLTVQRAHIRDVACRPRAVKDCPQSRYYPGAGAIGEADQA